MEYDSGLGMKCILRLGSNRHYDHNWHIAAPDVCDGTSLGKSRHRIPAHPLVKPTEPCLAAVLAVRALAAKVTASGWQIFTYCERTQPRSKRYGS